MFAIRFCSAGPKQYAFRTAAGKYTCKLRGFTLNHENAKRLNFETLKKLVLSEMNGLHQKITVEGPHIRRRKDRLVVTRPESKTYQYVFDKCRVMPDFTCLPFGY